MSLYVGAPTDRSSGTTKRETKKAKEKTERKDRVKAPTSLQKIFRCRNQPNSQYYFTSAKSVTAAKARDVLTESTPFKYPTDQEQFSFKVIQQLWDAKLRRRELRTRYCDRTNVKSRQNMDILRRLYVEEPEPSKEVTVLDIDPEYFTLIEGRPIEQKFSMSKYLEDIRNVLRTKLMTGFRKDEIVNIEFQLLEEQKTIDDINENFKVCLDQFESFLNQDYEESLARLRLADSESLKSVEKSDQIKSMYVKLASIEFNVYKLEERWRDLKMYQKFLFCISPLSWRIENDYVNKDELTRELQPDPSRVFRKYQLDSLGDIPPLEFLVDEYLRSIEHEQEPKLYFTAPEQLGKVFRFMEIQNLNSLLHTEDISIPMENMKSTMDSARTSFEAESHRISEMIVGLTTGIEWEERCVQDLKDTAMNLIDGQLRSLVSDDEVLKLHVYVEEVFESCVSSSDSNLNIYDMMAAIEQQYNSLALELEDIPHTILKKSVRFQFLETARLNKLYADTARKIDLVDKITWRLKKSLEPPPIKTQKDLKWRSPPPKRIVIPKPEGRNLTDSENVYLTYFTGYCKHRDRVESFGIDLRLDESNVRNLSVMDAIAKEQQNESTY